MVWLIVAVASVLISCGGSGGEDAPGPGARPAVDLRVVVWPEGPDGPRRVREIECAEVGSGAATGRCRALGGLEPDDLDPVPPDTACTEIYGGPATARVTGQLRGERVSASFSRANGCEIARWERNEALLGPPPPFTGSRLGPAT